MGNTSSERAALERQGGHKTPRRDSSGGAKDGDRPKILMDSPEDADLFHSEEIKVRGGGEPVPLPIEIQPPPPPPTLPLGSGARGSGRLRAGRPRPRGAL